MARRFINGAWRVLAVLTLLAGSQSAMAIVITPNPVTVHLTGTLTTVDDPLGGTFSVGQTLHVSYTFDANALARAGSDSTFAVYDALIDFELSIDGYTATSTGAPEIQVDNNPGGGNHDRYGLAVRASDGLSGPNVNDYTIGAFLARFDDSTDAVFSDALILPTSLDFSAFDSSAFFIFFDPILAPAFAQFDVNPALITGVFTSIEVEEPIVPEPATMLLTGSGLALLAGGLRRRAKKA